MDETIADIGKLNLCCVTYWRSTMELVTPHQLRDGDCLVCPTCGRRLAREDGVWHRQVYVV